ncbi:hypothetical protein OHC33_006300 [Knufia fluminis]|uniref:Uncharacterized protein n=1 Tax=Knufia fluminis TaxID=191047 RepID=A0AAN8EUX7_9EURO|nr:hypothetical protein OHC33_006300 [Knufia fluminis]
MSSASNRVVDVLVLGGGWTSQFLVPFLEKENLSYAVTTRTGALKDFCVGKYDASNVIPFAFVPDSEDEEPYAQLPAAHYVIVTFKVEGAEAARKLVGTYIKTHTGSITPHWILLGSTGMYEGNTLHNHKSDYKHTPRTEAEDYLLQSAEGRAAVLCLAGLWGDQRIPSGWVKRVAQTKEKLKQKASLHLIHGDDVARACVAMVRGFQAGRWIVTDGRVYDWWALIDGWADELEREAEAGAGADGQKPEYTRWLAEAMEEEGVPSLPRSNERLGRRLDSSHFWSAMGIKPETILTSAPTSS